MQSNTLYDKDKNIDYWANLINGLPRITAQPNAASVRDDDVVYKITMSSDGILINGLLLSKPQYGSAPYEVINYLYNHPNERISVEEMYSEINIKPVLTIHQILHSVAFKKDLRAIFFEGVSKKYVQFRNPITRSQLREINAGVLKVARDTLV